MNDKNNQPIIIYGVPNSQPFRAVVWLCLIKQLPFEIKLSFPVYGLSAPSKPNGDKLPNPRGTIPVMDDNGFILWESHAIMTYLCEKYKWDDYYPTNDIKKKALINNYLHFHHRNVREIVVKWSRTLWPSVFNKGPNPSERWMNRNTFAGLRNNDQVVEKSVQIVEEMLSENIYLTGDKPSIADISCYEEFGQNQEKYANVYQFNNCPNIQRWLRLMERLPHHETAHAIYTMIGDANKVSGGMKTIARANKIATKIIMEYVGSMRSNL